LDSAIAQSEVWFQRIAQSPNEKRIQFLADILCLSPNSELSESQFNSTFICQ